MLEPLNKLGLPVKWGIIGFGCGLFGAAIAYLLGLSGGGATVLSTALAGAFGGALGGWMRQRREKGS